MDWQKINRKIAFLTPGWWIIHVIGISAIYALGHLLWR
jgi:hypothetical protein